LWNLDPLQFPIFSYDRLCQEFPPASIPSTPFISTDPDEWIKDGRGARRTNHIPIAGTPDGGSRYTPAAWQPKCEIQVPDEW